ncbi:hypothetical protein Bca4012_089140 [Brassica carinata]
MGYKAGTFEDIVDAYLAYGVMSRYNSQRTSEAAILIPKQKQLVWCFLSRPAGRPARLTHFAVRDWAASFRTASRAGRSRRVPPEDKPAAGRDGTVRESPIAIPSNNSF